MLRDGRGLRPTRRKDEADAVSLSGGFTGTLMKPLSVDNRHAVISHARDALNVSPDHGGAGRAVRDRYLHAGTGGDSRAAGGGAWPGGARHRRQPHGGAAALAGGPAVPARGRRGPGAGAPGRQHRGGLGRGAGAAARCQGGRLDGAGPRAFRARARRAPGRVGGLRLARRGRGAGAYAAARWHQGGPRPLAAARRRALLRVRAAPRRGAGGAAGAERRGAHLRPARGAVARRARRRRQERRAARDGPPPRRAPAPVPPARPDGARRRGPALGQAGALRAGRLAPAAFGEGPFAPRLSLDHRPDHPRLEPRLFGEQRQRRGRRRRDLGWPRPPHRLRLRLLGLHHRAHQSADAQAGGVVRKLSLLGRHPPRWRQSGSRLRDGLRQQRRRLGGYRLQPQLQSPLWRGGGGLQRLPLRRRRERRLGRHDPHRRGRVRADQRRRHPGYLQQHHRAALGALGRRGRRLGRLPLRRRGAQVGQRADGRGARRAAQRQRHRERLDPDDRRLGAGPGGRRTRAGRDQGLPLRPRRRFELRRGRQRHLLRAAEAGRHGRLLARLDQPAASAPPGRRVQRCELPLLRGRRKRRGRRAGRRLRRRAQRRRLAGQLDRDHLARSRPRVRGGRRLRRRQRLRGGRYFRRLGAGRGLRGRPPADAGAAHHRRLEPGGVAAGGQEPGLRGRGQRTHLRDRRRRPDGNLGQHHLLRRHLQCGHRLIDVGRGPSFAAVPGVRPHLRGGPRVHLRDRRQRRRPGDADQRVLGKGPVRRNARRVVVEPHRAREEPREPRQRHRRRHRPYARRLSLRHRRPGPGGRQY